MSRFVFIFYPAVCNKTFIFCARTRLKNQNKANKAKKYILFHKYIGKEPVMQNEKMKRIAGFFQERNKA
jgi:hypothetical protein